MCLQLSPQTNERSTPRAQPTITAWISFTVISCDEVVKYAGSVSPTETFDVHVIDHTIDHCAENVPDPEISDECRYRYVHADFACSPNAGSHRCPGPSHANGSDPGSPGVNTKCNGVAVACAQIDPVGVGTHALPVETVA